MKVPIYLLACLQLWDVQQFCNPAMWSGSSTKDTCMPSGVRWPYESSNLSACMSSMGRSAVIQPCCVEWFFQRIPACLRAFGGHMKVPIYLFACLGTFGRYAINIDR
jgi:hypothetical protein